MLVPIPKKGDLSRCDNWRGITLDVVGKALAGAIQLHLQSLAKEFLRELQCGFRRGGSCSNMIFTIRQLLEKTVEHKTKGFFVFIDLRKAYDSVPHECLWQVLARAGVPSPMLVVIKSFHTSMAAVLRMSRTTVDPFSVDNGLPKGCSMASVLFNIFMWAVVSRWQQRVSGVPGIGFSFSHKSDTGNLYRKSHRTNPVTTATEAEFADDSALFATSRAGSEVALTTFDNTASEFGLAVSATKTKFLVVGADVSAADRVPLSPADVDIVCVTGFNYLGSVIHSGGRSSCDVDSRIANASRACGAF